MLGQPMIDESNGLYFGGSVGPGYAWGVSNVAARVGSFYDQSQFDHIEPLLADVSWKARDGNPLVPDAVGVSDADFVVSLYQKYFHRAADAPGLAFWVNEIVTTRKTRADVEQAFATSPDIIKTSASGSATVPLTLASSSSWLVPVAIVVVVLLVFKN